MPYHCRIPMHARFASIIVVVASLFTLFMQYNVQSADATYSATNVSNTSGKSDRAQIAVSGSNVYVVWQDRSLGNKDIFFAVSTDHGASFSDAINLSKNDGDSAFPRIAVSGSNAYVVWYDYTPRNSDIFFAVSTDHGASFSDAINLSKNAGTSFNPRIAVSGSNVYIVWNDSTKGNEDIVTGVEGTSRERNFDIVVGDSEIFLARSTNNGATFDLTNVSNSPDRFSWNPRIAVSGNSVYVIWNEEFTLSNSEIFLARSADAGASFEQPVNVSRSGEESKDAQLAVSDNNVCVIWNEHNGNNSEIYISKSINDGISFEDPVNLSKSEGDSVIGRDGQIAVSASNVYVLWNEGDGKGKDIYFARSADDGITFEVSNLSNNDGVSDFGQIVVSGDNVYVVWQDDGQGNNEVFFKRSVNNGLTFDSIVNISDSDTQSLLFILGPQVVVASDTVYVVWEESEDADDLFLKRLKFGDRFPAMAMLTDNGAVEVEVSIDNERIESQQQSQLVVRFSDPVTGKQIQDVSYALTVIGQDGKRILERKDLHANDGMDLQPLTLGNAGSFTLLIDVASTDTNGDVQHDPESGGAARVTFTVAPGSPLPLALVAITVLVSGAIASRFWNRFHRA